MSIYFPNEFTPFDKIIGPLENPKLWIVKDEDLLSSYLKQVVSDLRELVPFFIEEGYYFQTVKETKYSTSFLKHLCFYLSEGFSLLEAIQNANG